MLSFSLSLVCIHMDHSLCSYCVADFRGLESLFPDSSDVSSQSGSLHVICGEFVPGVPHVDC